MTIEQPFEYAGFKGVLTISTVGTDEHSLYSDHKEAVQQAISSSLRDLGDKLNSIKKEATHARGNRG